MDFMIRDRRAYYPDWVASKGYYKRFNRPYADEHAYLFSIMVARSTFIGFDVVSMSSIDELTLSDSWLGINQDSRTRFTPEGPLGMGVGASVMLLGWKRVAENVSPRMQHTKLPDGTVYVRTTGHSVTRFVKNTAFSYQRNIFAVQNNENRTVLDESQSERAMQGKRRKLRRKFLRSYP